MASLVLRDGRPAEVASVRRYTDDEVVRARHLFAARLRHSGTPVARIAEILGVTRQTVYNWLRDTPAEALVLAAL